MPLTSLQSDFKDAMATWASGVSVVTTRVEGLLYGLTVSSLASVSLDPPLVSVSLGNDNRLWRMIERSGAFAASILARDQEDVSNHFAVSGREPSRDFVEIGGGWAATGMPVIEGATGYVSCELHDLVPAGDHTIVIGRVVEADSRDDKDPLLYYRRGYRGVES
ncbi:MAG: flavin reductase family protein [Myxococcota bacterium]